MAEDQSRTFLAKHKVLHIIKGLGRGGAERLLVSTIRHRGDDWSYDVVYFIPGCNALDPELRRLGCQVRCLNSFGVIGMLFRLHSLIEILRSGSYDVIHAHLPWSGIIARLAGWWTGTPVVYTEHNLFHHYHGLTRMFNRLTYHLQNQVIAVSGQVAQAIPPPLASVVQVTVVNNGVDCQEFNPSAFNRLQLFQQNGIPENVVVVGNVASIRPQKRMDRWLTVAGEVIANNPNIFFVLVGVGKELNDIHQRVRMLKNSSKIILVGLQHEPASWMAMMDIFLMTSDYEGMPVALLEAMAMGCVPVATSVGGIPTVIQDSNNGFLFETEDTQQAVQRILELAGNGSLRSTMSGSARNTVCEKFNIRLMTEKIESIYSDLIIF